jgi:DNA replication protein DnaC
MLLQPTLAKMHEMKLSPMAEAFSRQIQEPQLATLAFEERVGMMIDAEYSARQERKITRRLQVAKLRQAASLEDIDWQSPRGLDRQQVLSLGTGGFIREHQNLLITGATGVGKSWLACAFAERACRGGFWAYYQRASRLFLDTSVARADGSYGRLLAKLAKMDLLVIDDFALSPLKDAERRDLLEILEDRHERASTLITSQLPIKAWHAAIGEETLADAICDRLIHGAFKIELKGASLRQGKIRTKTPNPKQPS